MRHHILFVGAASAFLLLCGAAGGEDDVERQHPQWAGLMEQARQAWSVGEIDRGNEKLLLAIELAKGFTSPVALARSLDAVGRKLTSIDLDAAMTVLEEARSIKEAELGPRSAEIADTLMVMANVVTARDYLANPNEDEPENYLTSALELYKEARALRAEAFGESSCEVGEVEVYIGLMYFALGKADKAEAMYREILAYCPVDPEGEGEDAGASAEASLVNLLFEQGRDEEADEIIYSRPLEEPKPKQDPEAAADRGPGVSDVFITDPDWKEPEPRPQLPAKGRDLGGSE